MLTARAAGILMTMTVMVILMEVCRWLAGGGHDDWLWLDQILSVSLSLSVCVCVCVIHDMVSTPGAKRMGVQVSAWV